MDHCNAFFLVVWKDLYFEVQGKHKKANNMIDDNDIYMNF